MLLARQLNESTPSPRACFCLTMPHPPTGRCQCTQGWKVKCPPRCKQPCLQDTVWNIWHHPEDAATEWESVRDETHSTGERCVYRWHGSRKLKTSDIWGFCNTDVTVGGDGRVQRTPVYVHPLRIRKGMVPCKKHTRAYCIVRLRKLIPEAFETVAHDMIKKFFVTCRDFEEAYRQDRTIASVDAAVKSYKFHKSIFSTTMWSL